MLQVEKIGPVPQRLQLGRDGSTYTFATSEAQSLERDDMILEVVAR